MIDKLFFALVIISALIFSFMMGHEFGVASMQGKKGYSFSEARQAFYPREDIYE